MGNGNFNCHHSESPQWHVEMDACTGEGRDSMGSLASKRCLGCGRVRQAEMAYTKMNPNSIHMNTSQAARGPLRNSAFCDMRTIQPEYP